jgi:hypothetical protein
MSSLDKGQDVANTGSLRATFTLLQTSLADRPLPIDSSELLHTRRDIRDEGERERRQRRAGTHVSLHPRRNACLTIQLQREGAVRR